MTHDVVNPITCTTSIVKFIGLLVGIFHRTTREAFLYSVNIMTNVC